MVVSFIFVSQDGLIHEIIGGAVRLATKSRFAHVAIGFDDCIIEAVAPKVQISPIDKFCNQSNREIISFVVSDEKYQEMYLMARQQLNKWYGLDDCLIGGLHDLFDYHFDHLDNENTIDCSALGTIIARVLFANLLDNEDESLITPERLYEALKAR